ncbi:hypothetical protein [Aestuariivivens sediminis]|uniref:hypothetical protein n=1 Tax=Aestuariivivens sediminis TaxID=2913557 RepID=UPI001F56EBEC|nr:hypothetical protein [Aestuariivivens sediminis]
MAKFIKFNIIAVVFIIAIPARVLGQEMSKKENSTIVGYKTVHLINIISVEDEAEFIAIADDFNRVVAELGYQNIRYHFWKEARSHEGQYKYIFESTWPDQDTYDKVHEYEKFKLVWEKNYAKWKKMIAEDIYNRYIPLN